MDWIGCEAFIRPQVDVSNNRRILTPATATATARVGLSSHAEDFSSSSGMSAAGSSNSRELRESILMQLRVHEIAIAELNGSKSSRHVYQQNGNIYFKTTVEKAKSQEQNQLASAKAKLKRLTS